MGDGESDHRTVWQIDGALHKAFSEGTAAYDETTVLILNGTRDNL
jgi:hypothetical protein